MAEGTVSTLFGENGELYEIAPAPRFGLALGTKMTGAFETEAAIPVNVLAIPGVASVPFSPAYGVAKQQTDAINLGILDVFKRIQDTMKQRNLPYDKAGVFMYMTAVESPHLVFSDIIRAYKALITYSSKNKYVGKALVTAMGYDYEDMFANRVEIMEALTLWKGVLDSYPLPKVFTSYETHQQMVSYIFADEESDKPQIYVPSLTWIADASLLDNRNRLMARQVHRGVGYTTWSEIRATMNALLTNIASSTNVDVIVGAINSTFAETGFIAHELPGTIDPLEVKYSEEFLDALRNASIVPRECLSADSLYPFQGTTGNVINDYVTVQPYLYFSTDEHEPIFNHNIINTKKQDISSPEFTRMMRWRVTIDPTPLDDDSTPEYAIVSCGPEIIHGFTFVDVNGGGFLMYNGDGGTLHDVGLYSRNLGFNSVVSVSAGATALQVLAELSVMESFNAHPVVFVYYKYSTTGSSGMYPFVNWKYSGLTNEENIAAAHRAIFWKVYAGK